jgi:hypothetical protein
MKRREIRRPVVDDIVDDVVFNEWQFAIWRKSKNFRGWFIQDVGLSLISFTNRGL